MLRRTKCRLTAHCFVVIIRAPSGCSQAPVFPWRRKTPRRSVTWSAGRVGWGLFVVSLQVSGWNVVFPCFFAWHLHPQWAPLSLYTTSAGPRGFPGEKKKLLQAQCATHRVSIDCFFSPSPLNHGEVERARPGPPGSPLASPRRKLVPSRPSDGVRADIDSPLYCCNIAGANAGDEQTCCV